jgi:MoxR-like ATPase
MMLIKDLAEVKYKEELDALIANDTYNKPENWKLSPQKVLEFICGSNTKYQYQGKAYEIKKKWYGNKEVVEAAVITLTTDRGLLLVGIPGTGKTLLSELLSAAICGDSTNTIQGMQGLTIEDIKYSLNYNMLLTKGPSLECIIKSPIYSGMESGKLVRFEELTRSLLPIQDSLISIMSDKVLMVPEIHNHLVQGKRGFNIIATSNTLDKGVNEMSHALKRRFNFVEIPTISSLLEEISMLTSQVQPFLTQNQIDITIKEDITKLIATIFLELRDGKTIDGSPIEELNNSVSSADGIGIMKNYYSELYYYNNKKESPALIVKHIKSLLNRFPEGDQKAVLGYFNTIVKNRSKQDELWAALYKGISYLK